MTVIAATLGGVGLWERTCAMLNGNFYKLLSLVLTLLMMVFVAWQQMNYTRLEERIAGNAATFTTRLVGLTEAIKGQTEQILIRQNDLAGKQEKLSDDLSRLNAEIQGYRMLPTQTVTNSKAIEQTRAQINMILYRVMGMQEGRKDSKHGLEAEQ